MQAQLNRPDWLTDLTPFERPAPPVPTESHLPTPREDSGLHQYRLMMAEMDSDRGSSSHKLAQTLGRFTAVHYAIVAILAAVGAVLASVV